MTSTKHASLACRHNNCCSCLLLATHNSPSPPPPPSSSFFWDGLVQAGSCLIRKEVSKDSHGFCGQERHGMSRICICKENMNPRYPRDGVDRKSTLDSHLGADIVLQGMAVIVRQLPVTNGLGPQTNGSAVQCMSCLRQFCTQDSKL